MKLFNILLLLIFIAQQLHAQEDLYPVMGEEGLHLYHFEDLPLGYSFNVYRKTGSQSYQLLNPEPVTGMRYPSDIQAAIPQLYEYILSNVEADNPTSLYFELRNSSDAVELYAMMFPAFARAFNRLYIDATATPGQTYTYKLEFLNDAYLPTGKELIARVTVPEMEPIAKPLQLQAKAKNKRLQLSWQYDKTITRNAIRFKLYQKNSNGIIPVGPFIINRFLSDRDYQIYIPLQETTATQEYWLTAVDISGRESAPAKVVYEYQDTEAPGIVSNFQADTRDGKILLAWNQSIEPDLLHYQIYRKEGQDENWQALATAASNQFSDNTALELTRYYYRVAAVDSSKNVGEVSIHAHAMLPDDTPPGKVENLTASFDGENVQLQWNAPNDKGPLKYAISGKRVNDGTEAYSRLHQDFHHSTQFTDIFFDYLQGDFYQFRVTAVDEAMNFGETTVVEVQIPDRTAPQPPNSVHLKNDKGNKIYISWQNASDWDLTEVKIYRGRDSIEHDLITTVPRNQSTFVDYEIDPATTYFYALTSVDSVGNESPSRQWHQVFSKDAIPPVEVRSLRLQKLENQTVLHWLPMGDQDLLGYNIYRSEEPNGSYHQLNQEPVSLNQFELKLPGWYHVKAVDTSGNESTRSEPAHLKDLKN